MKKLNRKGFTLIELLAVIVILAIIVVVTVPTVLNSIGDARQKTFNTSADTVADWVEKQYALYEMGTPTDAFKDWMTTNKAAFNSTTGADITSLLNVAGVKAGNYKKATASMNAGRVCVKLEASDTGDFATIDNTTATSLGC